MIPPDELYLFSSGDDHLFPKTMLELGNKKNKHGVYKDWFKSRGWQHTSVDINGLDGALALDLRKPLGLGVFSVVTNFGTTEHVGDQLEEQEAVWKNIYDSCGGVFLSVTPLPGDWPRHGLWYPKQEFYHTLGGFMLDRIYVGGRRGRRNIYARLLRTQWGFSCNLEEIFCNGSVQ